MREAIAALRGRRERQDGPKHDFWVVPYADMLTLLFAVFVMLYAIGEVRLQKLQDLRRSLSSAFRTGTDGQVGGDELDVESSATGGELIDGVELVTAQSGPMKQLLLDSLSDFREVAGRSLEIVVTDDTVAFEAPLTSFYEHSAELPRRDVQAWLFSLFEQVQGRTSQTRIRIEAPNVPVGRDDDGIAIRSDRLSCRRLLRLRSLLRLLPQVEDRFVTTEFRPLPPVLSSADWEAGGRIVFAFANR